MPGYIEGLVQLEKFVNNGLYKFAENRNDAVAEETSNLSPWFHFGHLSTQRALMRVMDFKKSLKNQVDIFVEEGLVRRELSENYCFYTENPDSPFSAPKWALESLKKHMGDKRPYIYSLKQLEDCNTHDSIWNAAQNQLKIMGKMSGYLRMYWAKKFLEWSTTPEIAFKNSLYLNDKYSIDGNDCNGIVGCMWSIYGLHDRPWKERPIFGYVRYMNEVGCHRHFKVQNYLKKYGV
ncbi:hypothetical protein MXB_195 [Myxobolus squamalis]|nr:hypothetical protein MXB_195 [Myxobolus squamalis]